jgi:ATP-dependent DNA helicase RecG
MIVIPTSERRKYLDALGKCDDATGREPYNGANAMIEQIQPFVKLISVYVEKKLNFSNNLIAGKISDIDETNKEQQREPLDPNNVSVNISVNVSVKENIIQIIEQFSSITVRELARLLSVTERTIYRNLNELKSEKKVERIGSDKKGLWRIKY